MSRQNPATNASTAQSPSVTGPGSSRLTIQIATPSIITPNACLTASIQAPAFGSNWPAEAPTSSSGAPMPRLKAKSAAPPRTTSPLWPITASDATSGGATQAVTIRDESAPMIAVPSNVPCFWLLLRFATRACSQPGTCTLKRPNMPSASQTNSAANSTMIQGFWNTACACWPAAANAAPATV